MSTYYKFYPSIDEYLAFSIIECPLAEQIYFPNHYKKISKEQYMTDIARNTHVIEKPLQYIQFKNNQQLIFFTYYYYYAKLIHELITKHNCSYQWLNILEQKELINHLQIKLIEEDLKKTKGNIYLANTFNNKKKLGLDILHNGMYFPFCLFDDYRIVLGKHRFYSLLQNKELIQNKKFLFIDLLTFSSCWKGASLTDFQKLLIPKGNEISCYCLNEQNLLFRTMHQEDFFIWNYFKHFSDTLALKIANYRNEFSPNPIFNSEKLFDNFINSPFQTIEKLENFIN